MSGHTNFKILHLIYGNCFLESYKRDFSSLLFKGTYRQNGMNQVFVPENDSFNYGILQAMATIRIEQAMNEYQSPPLDLRLNLDDGTAAKMDSKKPILIISTFRSGSSFLGELINSYPGSFYSFEPLRPLVNRDSNESKPELIESLFQCRFPSKYLKILNCLLVDGKTEDVCFMPRNWRVWSACQHDTLLCSNADFVNRICSFSTIRLAKVVRMRIKEFEPFLVARSRLLDWKIVYLIRDPRGIMSSRMETTWCESQRVPNCSSLQNFCNELEDDLIRIERLNKTYPGLFRVVQFENLTADIGAETKRLFEFLELPMTRSVRSFLNTHTDSDRENENTLATFRHTKRVASQWKTRLTQEMITLATNTCQSLLQKLHFHN